MAIGARVKTEFMPVKIKMDCGCILERDSITKTVQTENGLEEMKTEWSQMVVSSFCDNHLPQHIKDILAKAKERAMNVE